MLRLFSRILLQKRSDFSEITESPKNDHTLIFKKMLKITVKEISKNLGFSKLHVEINTFRKLILAVYVRYFGRFS